MKVIILAGGLGTRISEETVDKPKPMVLIDDKPILWHIMSVYAQYGFREFIVAAGYKGEVIANWVDRLRTDWEIRTIDTGVNTQTGGRIKKCMEVLPGERVMATYGDGLGNINIPESLKFHEKNRKLATVTAVRPPARFGYLEIENGQVLNFGEKNQSDTGWINGGFFILEPEVCKLIKSYEEPLETEALPILTKAGQLGAFKHSGFWQPMDTLRERNNLKKLVAEKTPPPWLNILS